MKRRNPSLIPLLCVLIFVFVVLSCTAYAGGGIKEYSIANIPDSLVKGADAVIRKDSAVFEVKNRKHAEETVVRAVTIFNKEEQEEYGKLFLWYDQFREIDDLDGAIYDANGNEIRGLNDDDIKDYCSFSSFAFYDGTRDKTAELYYDKFPYTVVFTYKLYYDGYLEWPTWYSRGSRYPVQLSSFKVIMHDNDTLRYWCNSSKLMPAVFSDDGTTTYTWEEKNLPLLSENKSGNDLEDLADVVRIAPSKFEIDGYKGDMNSWKDFGLWCYRLFKGQDIFSDQTLKKIHSVLKPQDGTIEIIQKLYKYMQSTTRYVSIELGIGGWKPLSAQFVFDKGYGDCKALSNYMMALLKTEDIDSYPVLINAGNSRPIISSFPSNQFDHVILCVPLKKDTVWLECTSSVSPFGHLGSFTENKSALLLTAKGGQLIHTPASSSNLNTQIRTASVTLGEDGSADVKCVTSWRGDQQDDIRYRLANMTPKEKTQWISSSLNTLNPNIRGYKFNVPNESNSNLTLNIKYSVPRYGAKSPHRIFFKPDIIDRSTYIPPDVSERLSPVRYSYPYTDFDSVYFKIPAGYTVEALPNEVNIATDFGKYSSKTIQYGDTAIVYKRIKEINKYVVPADHYTDYRKFYFTIAKSDRSQVVLHKK